MKINRLKGLSLLLAVGLAFTYSSCEKDDPDPEYPFEITVKTQEDSILAPNVFVEVYVPIDDNNVAFQGFTNDYGKVRFEYNKPAIFEVRATRGEEPDYTWIGCTDIRLEANTEVTKSLYIKPYDPQVSGCSR